MDSTPKFLLAILGVFLLIVVVAGAWFLGNSLRGWIVVPKPLTVPSETAEESASLLGEQTEAQEKATYSAIPETGPEETGMLLIAFSFVGGLTALTAAKRFST
jgi:cytoskeletal protein RodZ